MRPPLRQVHHRAKELAERHEVIACAPAPQLKTIARIEEASDLMHHLLASSPWTVRVSAGSVFNVISKGALPSLVCIDPPHIPRYVRAHKQRSEHMLLHPRGCLVMIKLTLL